MESNKEEALWAKQNAERLFSVRNFAGAKSFALKAEMLCPELEGISQMIATFEVYTASEVTVNGELDFYAILGLDPSVDKSTLKKQYKKMAVFLHPDKNKTIGADGAFKLVSEAWTQLSDSNKRRSYDLRRNTQFSVHTSERLDTFWTLCTSCHVQYEYLRKYLNKKLSCKNCRGIFIAVETGVAPMSGSFPYCAWSHGPNGVPHVPNTSGHFNGNGVAGYHSAHHRSESVPTVSFLGHESNGSIKNLKTNGKSCTKTAAVNIVSEVLSVHVKKRKVDVEKAAPEEVKVVTENGNAKSNSKLFVRSESLTKRCSNAPAFDARKLLIDKARTEIRKKLEELRSAKNTEVEKPVEVSKNAGANETNSTSITVPDSDFHDFDKDRAEECFMPKQIWAIYDEEDGMPRLYCLIRRIISINPFKIHISYLNAKTDIEFGSVNWIDSGFTKSCGSFRAMSSDIVDQVNIFSHVLSKEKTGRGGCVRIYPRSGDIWAVYRNWSPSWNSSTPDHVRHQYEMVEVLDDYSEELGVCVVPLIKLGGFKTVYQRNTNKDAIRWIPRREMLRFSHQVPSCVLKEGESVCNLPDGCWDLDPAATPEELLDAVTEAKIEQEKYTD